MLEIGLMLVFAVHLLAVNVATGGPLVCLGLEWRAARRRDVAAGNLARLLARHSMLALALGIALGVLMLGMIWHSPRERYFEALRAIPVSRLWFGLGELAFYFACMAGYLVLAGRRNGWRFMRWLLAVFAATNLMLHFPPLFAIISTLANRGSQLGAVLDRPAYYRLLLDPEVMSRVLHVWLASLAVSGALVMGFALRADGGAAPSPPTPLPPGERGAETPTLPPGERGAGTPSRQTGESRALAAWGAWLALVPTLLQLPVGLWVLLQLPLAERDSLLGSDLYATGLFALAMLAALRLMHQLAAVALGDTERKQIVGSLSTMVLVVVLMVAAWTRSQVPANAKAFAAPAAATSIAETSNSVPPIAAASIAAKAGLSRPCAAISHQEFSAR